MASNKNQHFVPRCHLKSFTLDGENLAISLFNIDRLGFIQNAPVKNQCSGDYFYGKDKLLEGALQAIEGAYGQVVSEIFQPHYCLDDEHRRCLRRFWLLQYMRTEAASRRTVEMQEGLREVVGASAEGFRSSIREAVQIAMRIFAQEMDAIDDLKLCLIRNRTSIPFVTSDDPAVMTNRWYIEDRRNLGRSPGLGSAGALMLLPLSPRVLCLIYDGDVYSVAHSNGAADVKREGDIQAFNQQQFLNCSTNIYFRDWDNRQWIHDDFLAVRSLRPTARHRINYAVYDRSEGGSDRFKVVDRVAANTDERAIIHSQTVLAKPSAWPRQIALRVGGSAYTNDTGVGYIRRGTIHRQQSGGFRKIPTR